MRRSKQTTFIVKPKGSKMTHKISGGNFPAEKLCFYVFWGLFLKIPGKLTGPVSYFEIEVSRKVGSGLTSNEVHFVSLAETFTV